MALQTQPQSRAKAKAAKQAVKDETNQGLTVYEMLAFCRGPFRLRRIVLVPAWPGGYGDTAIHANPYRLAVMGLLSARVGNFLNLMVPSLAAITNGPSPIHKGLRQIMNESYKLIAREGKWVSFAQSPDMQDIARAGDLLEYCVDYPFKPNVVRHGSEMYDEWQYWLECTAPKFEVLQKQLTNLGVPDMHEDVKRICNKFLRERLHPRNEPADIHLSVQTDEGFQTVLDEILD